MDNHFYMVGGDIRRQTKGGAIGSDLTGETALLYMLTWDKRFISKLKKLGIALDMFRRYVDDIIVFLHPVRLGWRYNSKAN